MVNTFLEKTKYYSYLIARPPVPTTYFIREEELDSTELGKDQTDIATLEAPG